MQVNNLTTTHVNLSSGYALLPSATGVTIADADFEADQRLRTQLNQLLTGAKIAVTTPPVGWTVSGGKILQSGDLTSVAGVEPAVNTEATLTIPTPGAGKHLEVEFVSASYSAAGIGLLTVESPSGTVLWRTRVHNQRDIPFGPARVRGASNAAVVVRLGAVAAAAGAVSATARKVNDS